MNKLVFLGGSLDGLIDRARCLGFEILVVQKKERVTKTTLDLADRILVCDYEKEEEFAGIMNFARFHQADFCVAMTEDSLRTGAKINDLLQETSSYSASCEALKDKVIMRERLVGTSLDNVNFLAVSNIDDLNLAFETLQNGFIVKPRCGVGSARVTRIDTRDDLQGVTPPYDLIAEEFIKGEEFSVESFSFQGQHRVVCITRKILYSSSKEARFVERAHFVTHDVNSRYLELASRCVSDFLDAVGYANGPAHTEIKIDGDRVAVIESHNRPGGDKITDLACLATDFDVFDFMVRQAGGLLSARVPPQVIKRNAGVVFFDPPPGVIKAIYGLEKLKMHPCVKMVDLHAGVGTNVAAVRRSSDRLGYFVASVDTGVDIEKMMMDLEKSVIFKVDMQQ